MLNKGLSGQLLKVAIRQNTIFVTQNRQGHYKNTWYLLMTFLPWIVGGIVPVTRDKYRFNTLVDQVFITWQQVLSLYKS